MNTKPRKIVWTILVIVLFCQWRGSVSASESEDAATVVAALRAAYGEILANAHFRATYEYRQGSTSSPEEAFADTALSLGGKNEHGTFCRRQSLVRHSRYGRQPPTITSVENAAQMPVPIETNDGGVQIPVGGRVHVKGRGYDEVGNSLWYIAYRPRSSGLAAQANLITRSEIPATPDGRKCSRGDEMLSPLNPTASCNRGLPNEPSPSPAADQYTIQLLDDEHLRIRCLSRTKDDTYGQVDDDYSVDWWMSPDVPVITRVKRVTSLATPEASIVAESRLYDFQKCGAHYLARRVVMALSGSASPDVSVHEWVSNDLGDELPRDEDFMISVPDSTVVMGMEVKPSANGDIILSILDVNSPGDILGTGHVIGVTKADSERPPIPRPWNTSLILLNVMLITTAVLLWKYWAKRSSS